MFVSWVIWGFQEPSFVQRYEDEENLVTLDNIDHPAGLNQDWSKLILKFVVTMLQFISIDHVFDERKI